MLDSLLQEKLPPNRIGQFQAEMKPAMEGEGDDDEDPDGLDSAISPGDCQIRGSGREMPRPSLPGRRSSPPGRDRTGRQARTPPPLRSPQPRARKVPGWHKDFVPDREMANLVFISTARTRSPTSDGGGARPVPVRGGGVGEVQDVEAEAGAEGDEGGEAEPPDPSAFQGGDQRVVGGSVVAGGVQGGGETSSTCPTSSTSSTSARSRTGTSWGGQRGN